jgi:hypothetical protein
MHFEGRHELRAPRESIFRALTDPATLQRCLPGCESLQKTGDNAYAASLGVNIGPVTGRFSGNVRLEEVQPPARYRIVFDGVGQSGFMRGTSDFELEEQPGLTVVKYSADFHVGGVLAAVGQRMLQGTARMLASKFFAAIESAAQTANAERPSPSA